MHPLEWSLLCILNLRERRLFFVMSNEYGQKKCIVEGKSDESEHQFVIHEQYASCSSQNVSLLRGPIFWYLSLAKHVGVLCTLKELLGTPSLRACSTVLGPMLCLITLSIMVSTSKCIYSVDFFLE